MSTQFRVLEQDSKFLSIDERSGNFDICLVDQNIGEFNEVVDITPDQLIDAAVRMIQIALYSHEDAVARMHKTIRDIERLPF